MSGSENLRDTQPYDGESQKDSEARTLIFCCNEQHIATSSVHVPVKTYRADVTLPILKFPLRSIGSKMSYLQDTVHSIFSNKGYMQFELAVRYF
ncbi:uncharacterized protein BT62DRAFT_938041 [Guyanagaster necrorhizus]|uniref:Uncharacterized protein n=1 Tax=Guyanagaster necrorhizus TaxID=856835 RepID=A0A9P7VHY2_9AGAR|nr:uncharacterized protein BT62DRAFT_938041 [Guyanagaster necrorhizus MCA 3950]KAG7440366.1 hypothetical protein BT62DRAFT_938041 [Guyanagaster necrorhizus MCA 3950]